MADRRDLFSIISNYGENQSNVSKVFESYGCSTLEAKVPIVDDRLTQQTKLADEKQQKHDALVFKSKAGTNVMEGRLPRTKDRQLTLVEIGKDTVISAGQVRERSPVDREELDDELEEYMRRTAELKSQRSQARETRQRAMQLPDISTMNIQSIDPDDWE